MKENNILITGGTGSLGTALVERLYQDPSNHITVLSRDPLKQATLRKKFPRVAFVLSDICDEQKITQACHGKDMLIHAAALKHVSEGELHPSEFARVNIRGSEVVANAWSACCDPQHALLISSDKAVAPINTYGATKMVAEGIFKSRGMSVLRYGNVVTSNGSFIHIWDKLRKEGKPISVSSPEPTRFFLSMSGAVDLVVAAFGTLLDSQIRGNFTFIPSNMRAFSVWDMAGLWGGKTIRRGLLPGEKQHEVLLSPGEGAGCIRNDLLLAVNTGWWSNGIRHMSSESATRMSADEFWNEIGRTTP